MQISICIDGNKFCYSSCRLLVFCSQCDQTNNVAAGDKCGLCFSNTAGHTLSQSVINKCTDLGMNNLESRVALLGTCRGGCSWINSHKESGSRLLSRSTAKGPSHQKLMSYLDHAVSSALYCENTAGLGEESPRECAYACVLCALCVSYRSTEGIWQLEGKKKQQKWPSCMCSCSLIDHRKSSTCVTSLFFWPLMQKQSMCLTPTVKVIWLKTWKSVWSLCLMYAENVEKMHLEMPRFQRIVIRSFSHFLLQCGQKINYVSGNCILNTPSYQVAFICDWVQIFSLNIICHSRFQCTLILSCCSFGIYSIKPWFESKL